jgi:SOS response associated peptidase (SRAP)
LLILFATRAAGRLIARRLLAQSGHAFAFGTLSHFCALDPVSAHYVKHHFVGGYEVVCDDATMTLPPNRFGAHYYGRALVPDWWAHKDSNLGPLWDEWKDIETGLNVLSCTMIVTTANALAGKVHDRMPVLLQPEDFPHWLACTASTEMLKPCAR